VVEPLAKTYTLLTRDLPYVSIDQLFCVLSNYFSPCFDSSVICLDEILDNGSLSLSWL